jgi:hypothetical protein
MLSWIPRWTDNPNFNAQVAHFGVGYAVGVTTFARTSLASVRVGVTLGFLAYALLKEFWYDAIYELPPQSPANNFEDFLFYLVGLSVGMFVGSL